MPSISVIGICGNSVFLSVDRFHEKGQTLVANSRREEIGGKGFNQAVAAARMGAQVSFLGAIGGDADAQKCILAAKTEGIQGHFSVKSQEMTTCAVILTDRSGENQVTVCPGAQLQETDVYAFEPQIAQSDILLLQQEVPHEVNIAAIRLAKKHGIPVILNPAPAKNLAYEDTLWLVTPNEHEKAGLGALSYEHCVTTLGKDGCSIDNKTLIKALPVTAVDTTGAGDTFNGVLAVCLAEKMTLEDACRWAVAASGLSVTQHGVLNAIPRKNEIERMVL